MPRWRGEPLTGQSILIGIEAGHGDMPQFCRYAMLLKARGAAKIGMICYPALKTLFFSLESADCLIALNEPLPAVSHQRRYRRRASGRRAGQSLLDPLAGVQNGLALAGKASRFVLVS